MTSQRLWLVLPILLGVYFSVLAVHAAKLETPTIDEFAHMPAGLAYWTYGEFDLYRKNPPLMKQLMSLPVGLARAKVPPVADTLDGWAPWSYGYRFLYLNANRYLDFFFMARTVVIAAALLAGLVLYLWTRSAFDHRAAALITALYFSLPSVLAHGHLATIDVGCMATILLCVATAWWTYRKPSWRRVALLGATWGVALLVKFTAVLLLPALVVMIVAARGKRWRIAIAEMAVVALVASLTINVGVGFRDSFEPVGSYAFRSSFAQGVQSVLPAWLPVPLPRPYVSGFDDQKVDTESAEGASYLFGRWSPQGRWYYHLVALAVKVPIPILLMIVVGGCTWRSGAADRITNLAVFAPAVALLLPMLFLNQLNIGIRYLLPILPLLLLLIGPGCRLPWVRWAGLAAVGYCAIANALTHPGHLAYFNLAVGGPRNGHKVLLDSNIDWGQDLYRLNEALDELDHDGPVHLLYFGHVDPRIYGIEYDLVPPQPTDGIVAVSVHHVMGGVYFALAPDRSLVPIGSKHVQWLREREPTLRAGSIWVYDLRP